jgi:GxxExxY protein
LGSRRRAEARPDNDMTELLHPKLSYIITGICFDAQNKLGRFAKERQYANWISQALANKQIPFVCEYRIPRTNDRVDFLIDEKIIVELKSKRYLLKTDYYQTQRYLCLTNLYLALLINFQNRHLKPLRILRKEVVSGNELMNTTRDNEQFIL